MTIRNPIFPVVHSPALGPLTGRGGRDQTLTEQVAAIFAGTPGVMLDWSDPSLLFQNDDGTGAVTIAADPVGYVTDLSGNNNHATAFPDSDARPVFGSIPSTVFAGASCIATPSIDFSGSDKLTVVESFRLNATGDYCMVTEHSTNINGQNGSFYIATNSTGAIEAGGRGTVTGALRTSNIAAPFDRVVTVEYDIAQAAMADEINLRLNAVVPSTAGLNGPLGTGSFGNYAIYFGARAGSGLFLNGALYRTFVIRGTITTEQRALVEAWAGEPASLFFS